MDDYLGFRRRQRITQIISLLRDKRQISELPKLRDVPGGALTADEITYIVEQRWGKQ